MNVTNHPFAAGFALIWKSSKVRLLSIPQGADWVVVGWIHSTWNVIDSTVDDQSSFLHPLPPHHLCSACSHHQDVGPPHLNTGDITSTNKQVARGILWSRCDSVSSPAQVGLGSLSDRWSLWHGSKAAGHAWEPRRFYCDRWPQRVCLPLTHLHRILKSRCDVIVREKWLITKHTNSWRSLWGQQIQQRMSEVC